MNESTNIQCAYCADIYQLHTKISNDEDLDTFVLLKQRPHNQEILNDFDRDDFAEIYMFFDYDGHAKDADNRKIIELLDFFNEETESGKLYLSYPMVEALKHIPINTDFKELKVPAFDDIKYKKQVNDESNSTFQNFHSLTKEKWIMLIEFHLKKMNFIIQNEYSIPTSFKAQNEIFAKQLENYIEKDSTVAVLSSFPIFLFDYYGYQFIKKLLDENI